MSFGSFARPRELAKDVFSGTVGAAAVMKGSSLKKGPLLGPPI